jgi:hypothetical protein
MNNSQDQLYSIPARYRKMENMHIIFWLLKDISWCMIWKPLGIAMIFPTLIIFWITANAYWMISEFLGFDETQLLYGIEGKYLAIIPFSIGILFLAYYYIFQKPKETKQTFATM